MSQTLDVRLKGRFGALSLDVDFKAPARGITAVAGRSGAGKTTLLRCIAGLDRAQGEVRLRDEIWQSGQRFTPPHQRGIGYVFQEPALFSHLSLRANLRYGLKRAHGRPHALNLDAVVTLLGLEPLLERTPQKLSGGERQRGVIGRALLSQPRLLLLDEPTASLDAEAKADLLVYLERLHQDLDLPILYVSHDLQEIRRLADRTLLMQGGGVVWMDEEVTHAKAEAKLNALSLEGLRALARAALLAELPRQDR
jgi:molybdate transport system ATP-binding protein